MSAFFITAIGTDIGKTFVTAALAHQLRLADKQFRVVKPIISGFEENDSESATLAQASGLAFTMEVIEAISPWRFTAPLAPSLAAEKEGREVPFDMLISWCRERMALPGTTLIEGVGGLMVPLTHEKLVIDWIAALDIPVILVSGSYLGAINHTLLSLEALRSRNIPVHAVIISQSCECSGLPDVCDAIADFLPPDLPLIPIERVNTWKDAPDLLSLIV